VTVEIKGVVVTVDVVVCLLVVTCDVVTTDVVGLPLLDDVTLQLHPTKLIPTINNNTAIITLIVRITFSSFLKNFFVFHLYYLQIFKVTIFI
jgi:hypothetical protein